MAAQIKTVGELREFLANMLVGIKSGLVKPDDARNMVNMAAQINESFYSEIKIAKINSELKRESHELGRLPINEKDG